jgi:dipeptidyl aminopeptidase/acylaminoacyl peptidase
MFAFLTLLAPTTLLAQGTVEDYHRYHEYGRNFGGKVFYDKVDARWFSEGSGLWYQRKEPDNKRSFVVVFFDSGKREAAFDHERLANHLGAALKRKLNAAQLNISDIQPDGKKTLYVTAFDKGWIVERKTGKVTPTDKREAPGKPKAEKKRGFHGHRGGSRRNNQSPDKKWDVVVKDNEVSLRNRETKEETPLRVEALDGRNLRGSAWWAPDSSRFVLESENTFERRQIHIVESSPKDQLQPKLHELNYPKPGDPVRMNQPHLFTIETGEVRLDRKRFATPWQLSNIRWFEDSSRFCFYYNARGHQAARVISVSRDGEVTTAVDDTAKTFVDYSQKTFLHWLSDDELIWASERDGWNHLYLIDPRTGKVKNQITKGKWLVRGIDWVDANNRQIGFRAVGMDSNQDPYYVHYCRIDFSGRNLVRLTDGDGTHELTMSPGGGHYLDRYTRVDMAGVTELRRTKDGKKLCILEEADLSALEATGWKPPEPFVAKGRDGKTDIYGVIFTPSNLDPKRKYPVIEAIYAGPHGQFVPKNFRTNYFPQKLTELGFIVVQIDGMGTNWRSKAFHDVCWQNVGDAGFPDRIAWMKAAAKKRPYMDLTRVGIFGGSAGGQSTLGGLLQYPDFYKVGAADCGCHDNRMDKVWWNEAWMGWPVGPHYEAQSNVTMAHKLKGKVLLTVGELDKNVDPASTMQVVDALIKADKDFELIIFPSGGHGAGGSPYGTRRRNDFFVRHLLGVEPPPPELQKPKKK